MTEEESAEFEQEVKYLQHKMKWTVIDGDVYDITNYIKMHQENKSRRWQRIDGDVP